jgi:hypothetical protein
VAQPKAYRIKLFGPFGCWVDIVEDLQKFLSGLKCEPRLSLPDHRYKIVYVLYLPALFPHLLLREDCAPAFPKPGTLGDEIFNKSFVKLFAEYPDAAPAVFLRIRQLIDELKRDKKGYAKWYLRTHDKVRTGYSVEKSIGEADFGEIAWAITHDPKTPRFLKCSEMSAEDVRRAWRECDQAEARERARLADYIDGCAKERGCSLSNLFTKRCQ